MKSFFPNFSCILALLCCFAFTQTASAQSQLSVTYTSGGFNGENSWIVYDTTLAVEVLCGNNAASGVYSAPIDTGNVYELHGYESFGDGWCPPASISLDVTDGVGGSMNLYFGNTGASGNGSYVCGSELEPNGAVVFSGALPCYMGFISGPRAVCAGNTVTYCFLEDSPVTPVWESANANAVIIGDPNQDCVEVEFVGAPGTSAELSAVSGIALCEETSTIQVDLGEAGGQLACISDANIGLDGDCSLVVTPELVLQGNIPPTVAYEVIVMDPQGNPLPQPIITGEHIGVEMTIKVVDACTNNSCWTSITVNDNIAPTMVVEDVTIDCNAMEGVRFPMAFDNCGLATVPVALASESTESLSCDPDYTTIITRTFLATDAEGNVSDTMEQKTFLARINLDSIVFPEDRTVQNNNPIFCQQYEEDENGNPAATETGVPTYKGESLFPYQDEFCSFGISYTDQIIQPNGCVQKIMRTWTAFEWWCGQALTETVVQEINIADESAPTFAVPANITTSTNTGSCVATVALPAVEPTDDCSTTFEVDIVYPGGFVNNSNGASIDFELGTSTVTYTVYDGCLNSSSESFTVTVVDNIAPQMVCDQNTVISLKADGTAYAPASVFDDGTIEDCSAFTLEVMRMDEGAACNLDNTEFGEYVEFCCADVGVVTQVILRATDADGNVNECMVNVEIQDKNPPILVVPSDMTIECTDVWDPLDLAATFGVATATDNCQVTDIEEIPLIVISDCLTGTITRTFIASDGNGTDVGTQVITVENNSTFDEMDIDWPDDLTTDTGCNSDDLSPENLDYPYDFPVLTSDQCDMVSYTYTEQTFETSDNSSCAKIIRSWIVMDECNLDLAGNPTLFNHDQTIVIENNVAPVISTSCEAISSSQFADCVEAYIELFASATDDCTSTELLPWTLNIDLDQNGSFDYTESGIGGTIEFSSLLPLGNHTAIYQWEDLCGNTVNCSQDFTLFNEIPPLAKCVDLAVELTAMDTDGDNILDAEMAFVPVELVGGTSEHPCGSAFTLSYDAAGDSTVATFDCFNLGFNEVTVFVTDEFGNQSSCTSTIEIQDNNNVDICPTVEDCIMWPDTNLLITTCVVDLDPTTIMSAAVVETPCVCDDFTIDFVDTDASNPADACAIIIRDWTITFNCFSNPMVFEFEQEITQQNATAPIIDSCPADGAGMDDDGDCLADVTLGLPTVLGVDECSFGVVITNDSEFADSNTGAASGAYPVGTTTVIYTVTDLCGNASTCAIEVVVSDNTGPNCNTQDITISIPSDASPVTIANDAVNNGSIDDCGFITGFSVTPNTFDCTNLGDNTVVMTVTDNSGNTSTCSATVTVEDLVAPICMAMPITVSVLDLTTPVVITAEMIDDGSFDDCGEVVGLAVSPNTFDCSNAGVNTVTLTVTDDNGNTSECTTTVTVLDEIAPNCNTMDITITIPSDASPVTIANDAVNNGSIDDCGFITAFAVTPNTFDCDDAGDNTVVMTVTDNNGNTSTCTATVTVEDDVAPTCVAMPATVTLVEDVPITIPASLVDGGSFDACGSVASISVSPDTFDCSNVGDNTVTLTVTDNFGNTSECTTTVTVVDMVAPLCVAQDITVTLDAMGSITIAGADVDGGSTDVCGTEVNFSVTPDTFTCEEIGDNPVVLTVTDGSGNTSTCTATVTVVDEVAPTCMAGVANVQLFSTVAVTVPASFVDAGSFDTCGEIDTIFITPNVFGCDAIGSNTVILTVVDNSGNSSTCEGTVNVTDNTAPVCVSQDITINIETDGSTTIEGIDIDNGSTDACGEIVTYEVSPNTFDCTNVGDNPVVLTVTDNSGNTCTSDAIVTVESAAELMCSTQDVTIFLDEMGVATVTAAEVDNGSMAPCGSTITLSLSQTDFDCDDAQANPTNIMFFATDDVTGEMDTCFSDITVLDTIAPTVVCPLDLTFDCMDDLTDPTIFGAITFDDNCPGALMMDTTIVDNRNNCGIGTIERTYMAEDLSGNTAVCTQTITVENAAGMALTEASIIWPDTNIMVLDCSMTSPEELMSFPTIDSMGLGCINVSIEFMDMSVGMSMMCLDTIQRTWTVTDSCQLDGSGAGIFSFNQFLFVDDSDIPTIMGIPTDTTLFVDADSCDVFVDLSAVTVMDCSVNITATNDSPVSMNPNSLDASGEYPLGTTVVTITSADQCGNADTFMITINIIDTIAPVMTCFKTFPQITDDGTATLTPMEAISFLSDNCTDSASMTPIFILDFTEDDTDPTDNPTATSLIFDCDDLGIQVVYVIVYDESGNFTFCAAATAIEDPNGFCGPVPNGSTVAGKVSSPAGEPVGKTELTLSGNTYKETVTELDGSYSFGNIYGLGLFDLTPYNDNDVTQGVTTLDILIIQKHIMNMSEIESPYYKIAADADKSSDITGADIITLQKLILGDYQQFPENTSFRFVDEAYTFPTNDPFSVTFPEQISWNEVTSDVNRNFIGIKIGDVNGSFEGNGIITMDEEISSRTLDHDLRMNDKQISSINGKVEIPIYADDFESLQALEMTLRIKDVSAEYIKPGSIDITSADYSIRSQGSDVKISWVNAYPLDITENEALFTIVVNSHEAIFASDVVRMQIETNEFYRGNEEVAKLRFDHNKSEIAQNKVILEQNTPNPWTNETTINFEMFKDADYTINFFTPEGKLVHVVNGAGVEGNNSVTVTKEAMGGNSGVMVYEFITENRKLVKRMILIE